MSIGEKLVRLRGDKTIVQAARDMGLTPSALANYEHDYRIPRDETKVLIAKYYGVSIEELFFAQQNHSA